MSQQEAKKDQLESILTLKRKAEKDMLFMSEEAHRRAEQKLRFYARGDATIKTPEEGYTAILKDAKDIKEQTLNQVQEVINTHPEIRTLTKNTRTNLLYKVAQDINKQRVDKEYHLARWEPLIGANKRIPSANTLINAENTEIYGFRVNKTNTGLITTAAGLIGGGLCLLVDSAAGTGEASTPEYVQAAGISATIGLAATYILARRARNKLNNILDQAQEAVSFLRNHKEELYQLEE